MKFLVGFLAVLFGVTGGIHFITDTKPTRFFHESENQYTPKQVMLMVKKYGRNIIIGGDEGHGIEFLKAMKAAEEHGALKHVYIVGPGMWEWSEEERNEIRSMAKSVGISLEHKGWLDTWRDWGWKAHVERKFVQYDAAGFYSLEIDNLDSVLHTPDDFMKYYRELYKFLQKHEIQTKLVIKNLNHETLKALILEIESGRLSQSMFAPVGIFEKGTGDPHEQTRLAKKLGITAVTPLNGLRSTNNYGTIPSGVSLK